MDFQPTTGEQVVRDQYPGVSRLDYFAAAVIGPLMASDGFEQRVILDRGFNIDDLPKFAAEQAFYIAEAMLAESIKRGGGR
jgi:hypothetical protein